MASGDAKRMLPLVVKAFAELGYRRATTAALAKRCGVRENVLYRIWPSKKEMFLAAIDHVWQSSSEFWRHLVAESGTTGADSARLILKYESTHHGETGLYKVIFAGLTEAHDPQIAAALRRMYRNFQMFIVDQVSAIRQNSPDPGPDIQSSDEIRAWGLVAVATMVNIDRTLKLLTARERSLLFSQLANLLIAPGILQTETKLE
jgi:AcrR family transcriptional regulator